MAATAFLENLKPSEVSVRQVQQTLLENRAYLLPFIDVKPNDKAFLAIQRIGATGILKGFGIPYKWANETWFYPDRTVSEFEWLQGLLPYYPQLKNAHGSGAGITLDFMQSIFQDINPKYNKEKIKTYWDAMEILGNYDENLPLDRRAVSVLTDSILDPFAFEVDFNGDKL